MNDARFNLVVVISFGVVSAVLLVAGLIFLIKGFDAGSSAILLVFGLGFGITAFGLARDFGFIEKWWL